MTEKEKLTHCIGCLDDFYNDKNPLGIKRCWMLEAAKLVRKVKVHINQRPPWTQPAEEVFDCRHESGYVFIPPENIRR